MGHSVIALRDTLVGIQVDQVVEIRTDDCPKVNSLHQLDGDVTVQLDRFRDLEHNGRSVTVRVVEVWQHRAGGFVVRCKVRGISDLPTLMHKNPWRGTTHDPKDGAKDEPEEIDTAAHGKLRTQADTVYLATHADEQRKKEAKSLAAQTKEEIGRARQEGVDIEDNLERLRAELDEIRRKRQAAA